ncbi:MAG: transcription termination factor Rho [Anaerovoracaceae bacterium]|jgi:transcription termination factor Rho
MLNIDLDSLKSMKVAELRDIAAKIGIENPEAIHKVQLRQVIADKVMENAAQKDKKSNQSRNDQPEENGAASEGNSTDFHARKTEHHENHSSGQDKTQAYSSRTHEERNYRHSDSENNQKHEYHRPSHNSYSGHHHSQNSKRNEEEPEESRNFRDKNQKQERKYSDEERPQVEGILDIADGGFGFLRFRNFMTSDKDIYVSQTQIRRFNLKTGDRIKGITRKPNEGERFGALLYVNTVNGDEPGVSMRRPNFEDLTPVFPYERIRLEGEGRDLSMRLIDLFAPIGKGQRGLIVAPPKTGKTVLLKKIACSIEEQYPEMHVMVLLIDERPEEVTDMKRSIKGEVIYSTFDEQAEHHVKVAEMVIAHAQRLAEHKKDVIVLLDSITRLARAYNMVVPASGKTLSGGIDPGALHKPKKFFGSARKLEEGGSITILATALIETGSRMDDVIFEEFKGTGNMELHLDRKLSERRIFPAININKSGTRREDLLLTKDEIEAIYKIRRAMSSQGSAEVTEKIIDNIAHTRTNKDFIEIINRTKVLG